MTAERVSTDGLFARDADIGSVQAGAIGACGIDVGLRHIALDLDVGAEISALRLRLTGEGGDR